MEGCSVPKKVKKAREGAAKYQSRFKKECEMLYPISSVPNSPGEFRCTVCNHIVPCSHQGEADVKRHMQGTIHQKK